MLGTLNKEELHSSYFSRISVGMSVYYRDMWQYGATNNIYTKSIWRILFG